MITIESNRIQYYFKDVWKIWQGLRQYVFKCGPILAWMFFVWPSKCRSPAWRSGNRHFQYCLLTVSGTFFISPEALVIRAMSIPYRLNSIVTPQHLHPTTILKRSPLSSWAPLRKNMHIRAPTQKHGVGTLNMHDNRSLQKLTQQRKWNTLWVV